MVKVLLDWLVVSFICTVIYHLGREAGIKDTQRKCETRVTHIELEHVKDVKEMMYGE